MRLTLSEASETTVGVYDVLGREVTQLHDGPLAAGVHPLVLGAAALPAGLYILRAEGDGLRLSRRVSVLR